MQTKPNANQDHFSLVPLLALRGDSYEMQVPLVHILPHGLTKVSITEQGIYVEAVSGGWELIPFDELSGFLSIDPDVETVIPITAAHGSQQ